MTHGRGLWVVVLAASVGVTVFAQTTGGAGEVYTCVDKNGKKLTSDRLIPECSDREQRAEVRADRERLDLDRVERRAGARRQGGCLRGARRRGTPVDPIVPASRVSTPAGAGQCS